MSTILLIGGSGQVGWELQRALMPLGTLVVPARGQCDLAAPQTLSLVVNLFVPARMGMGVGMNFHCATGFHRLDFRPAQHHLICMAIGNGILAGAMVGAFWQYCARLAGMGSSRAVAYITCHGEQYRTQVQAL